MATERFIIPAKPSDADGLANELGVIATATEWKRAALVYARVTVGEHGGDRSKVNGDLATSKLPTTGYALLGIHGLRSKTTIRAYWRAWDNAINEGLAQPVSLGDDVELPDAEWADYYHPLTVAKEPYYRPESESHERRLDLIAEPLDDPDELGHCPPLASDLEAGEDDELARALTALRENARRERERLDAEIPDDPDDDEEWQKARRRIFIENFESRCRGILVTAGQIGGDLLDDPKSVKDLKRSLGHLISAQAMIRTALGEDDE